MAKVTAPLFGFTALGQLAKSLVYSAWKGLRTVRQYTVPANPNSTAQQTQRGLFATIVAAWRRTDLSATIRAAWDRAAGLSGKALSGFNLYSSNLVKLIAEDPDASAVVDVADTSEANVQLALQNLDDGATGDEAGTFAILYGDSPANMVYDGSTSIVAGELTFDPTASGFAAADTIYVTVRKAGTGATVYERSGIIEITLT